MKRHQELRLRLWAGMAASMLFFLASGVAAASGPVGDWQGSLDTGNGTLRIVLHVSQGADASLTGTLDSPDQHATGIPISSITYKEPALHFESESIHGTYDGTMSKDGSRIEGQWKQGGAALLLNLARVSK